MLSQQVQAAIERREAKITHCQREIAALREVGAAIEALGEERAGRLLSALQDLDSGVGLDSEVEPIDDAVAGDGTAAPGYVPPSQRPADDAEARERASRWAKGR